MSEITQKLSALLGNNSGAPFLFVGSGFSRRYIGLEQWDELLSKFCDGIKEFGYYASHNNNDLPGAATDIAKDFNEFWWNSPKYEPSREKNKNNIKTSSSALKLEIASYLYEKAHEKLSADGLSDELEALSRLNVDGVITTNWDLFLEELFPDYKVFVGQEELLFANPQSVAEIYKIHGCASQPDSLILTQDDYQDFDSKNAYLAAKLITIFIEHPVIFIGYSLGDRNIQNIISSIVSCLGQDKLDSFARNLIFLQRCKSGEPSSFQPSMMSVGETNLNITVIKTNDFLEAYSAVEATKRKIPARILRYCKEQMYDLVKTTEPSTKLAVLDIDQIENKDDIEFVVGVGVAEVQERFSKKGYTGIGLNEIFVDIVNDEGKFDADQLLSGLYPTLFKRPNKYIPAYKYLQRCKIKDIEALRASKHAAIEVIIEKSKHIKSNSYQNQFNANFKGRATQEIIDGTTSEKAALMIPFQPDADIDLSVLQKFLEINKDKFNSEISSYSSYFRKIVCLYDRLKYGFD